MVIGENSITSFESNQFCMRLITESDQSFYISLFTDSETMHHIGDPLNQSEAVKRFKKELTSSNQNPSKNMLWIITTEAEDKKMGLIGISQRSIFNGNWELGVILAKQAVDKGIAKEAIKSLTRKLLGKLKIDELYGRIKHKNYVSISMVKSLGFENYKNDEDYGYWVYKKKNWG
ncbi:GNAT family N-acetyltransferase [Kangiella koreensis]|uniref:GCN5-related N-acetyltransferase n=1 Tax=Kangiella koreensis (strain DSM 16069 / JCM 12317 / KCTC 12182 / SW-125) TaxID=523791 RepID=C7R806_KANKD|nr:GNAT family N-acetyltransferase [Kangiella koreensis]ACV25788.1 GCN5-related N-acetyltransferase [Kangiella koreensis DSM 16069]